MSTDRLKDESGFTLTEVLVAILLLSIAIIPMVGMFDAGLRSAVVGSNYDTGRTLANGEMEAIRALPFRIDGAPVDSVYEMYPPVNGPSGGSPKLCPGSIPSGFTCQVTTNYVSVGSSSVTPDSSARSMMQVDITVKWDGGSRSYTTTGLISKETRCAVSC